MAGGDLSETEFTRQRGHTLLMVASSYTVLPATSSVLPYDSERDLAPIARVSAGMICSGRVSRSK